MSGSWFEQGGAGDAVDVHELVDLVPFKAVLDIVQAGALVSMGTTSDGGALGVTITVDGRWRREYFRSGADLTAWLAEALPAVEEARGTARPSAARGQRARRRTTP